MNDELKMKILEFWLEHPDKIGDIPKDLKKKVTDEDIDYLIAEIGKEITSLTVFEHFEKIRKKVYETQTLELQRNSIEIQDKVRKTQESVTKSQWIMTFAMVITVVINLWTYSIEKESYSIELESLQPQIKLSLDCSPISANNTVKITPTLKNYGEIGDYVYGEITSENITMKNLRVSDVPYQKSYKEGEPIKIGDTFVDKNKPIDFPLEIDVKNTKNDFKIIYKFWCKSASKPCRFLSSNVMSCEYHFNGTHHIYQQTCISQS